MIVIEWLPALLRAAGVTIAVAACGFLIGALIGALVAAGKLSANRPLRWIAETYTTVLRGVPDLLVIFLFYFGGSAMLGGIAALFGAQGFISVPAFATGAVAIGVIQAAYQAEIFRGAYRAIAKGEIEAAKACGMGRWLTFRRIAAPQVLRFAVPGLGNVWQLALKESALISVTGLVELLRQTYVAAGSTRRPFEFYLTAGALYLIITFISSLAFKRAEAHALRSVRRA